MKIRKWCHKWILNSLITNTPPVFAVFICVFGTVFSVGFWCAHLIDEISFSSYRLYDVMSDNIGGYTVLNVMRDLLPVDVVYTWVNGSDPLLIENLKNLANIDKFSCSYPNCFPSNYYARPVEAALPMLSSQGENFMYVKNKEASKKNITKEFQIFRKVPSLTFDYELKGRNGYNSSLQQAYWTSDSVAEWSSVWKKAFIITLEPENELHVEVSNISPANYEQFAKECTIVEYSHTHVVECTDAVLVEKLIADFQKYCNLHSKRQFPKVWKAYLIMKFDSSEKKLDITNRYVDNDELRYSLRSLEKFAPWVRRVFIVTNGQIPYWINLDNPRISIITHEAIFADHNHLPTFSSPAIESNIHRIPGLSEHFLYLNDDIMLGEPVWLEDFYSPSSGYKVYLSWSLPECSSGCAGTWISDGYCDHACNNSACSWDGGDCSGGQVIERDEEQFIDSEDEALFGVDSDSCSFACSDSWLADSFCDSACKSPSCGFDAGDCGLEIMNENLYKLPLDVTNYHKNKSIMLPQGVLAAWMDIKPFFVNKNSTFKGSYSKAEGVRTIAANIPLGVLVFVFKSNNTGVVGLNVTVSSADSEDRQLMFFLKFNTHPVDYSSSAFQRLGNLTETFVNFSFKKLSPAILNNSLYLASLNAHEFSDKVYTGSDRVDSDKKSVIYDGDTLKNLVDNFSNVGDNVKISDNVVKNNADGVKTNVVNVKSKMADKTIAKSGDKILTKSGDKISTKSGDSGLASVVDEVKVVHQKYINGELTDMGFKFKKYYIQANKSEVLNLEKFLQKTSNVTANKKRPSLLTGRKLLNVQSYRYELSDSGTTVINSGNDDSYYAALKRFSGKNDEMLNSDSGKTGAASKFTGKTDSTLEKFSWKNSAASEKFTGKTNNTLEKFSRKNSAASEKFTRKTYITSDNFSGSNDGTLEKFSGNFPWERNVKNLPQILKGKSTNPAKKFKIGRKLLDQFGDSLLFVNQLYNSEYGYQARRVPAHMPHFINTNILKELHDKFSNEFNLTSSHKVRQGNDMQFSFSYFYYLMSEKREKSVGEIFDEFDTDMSGTWSDREVRTFLTRTNELPLAYKTFLDLHSDIKNCSLKLKLKPVPTPLYERYADSDVPTISKELVEKCNNSLIMKYIGKLQETPKFPHFSVSDSSVHFKMITSNVSTVVSQLDEIRKSPRKFICLNSNLDPKSSENELIFALLQDAYESLYPIPSSFELPPNYRNRFVYTSELEEWKRWKNIIRSLVYACLSCFILLTVISVFGAEVEAVKRKWCRRLRKRNIRFSNV